MLDIYWTDYLVSQLQDEKGDGGQAALPPLSVESTVITQPSAVSMMVGEPGMDISTTEMEDTILEPVEDQIEVPMVEMVDVPKEPVEEHRSPNCRNGGSTSGNCC